MTRQVISANGACGVNDFGHASASPRGPRAMLLLAGRQNGVGPVTCLISVGPAVDSSACAPGDGGLGTRVEGAGVGGDVQQRALEGRWWLGRRGAGLG